MPRFPVHHSPALKAADKEYTPQSGVDIKEVLAKDVAANQFANWCGSPPVEWYQPTGRKSLPSPSLEGKVLKGGRLLRSSGGLPRQCAHWLAMTIR